MDTTNNYTSIYISEVISNKNYAIIYLCYPGQKYFTDFYVMYNCRSIGHLYKSRVMIKQRDMIRCCKRSFQTSLWGQGKLETKCTTFWTQIRTAQTHLTSEGTNFYIRTLNWVNFFCWKVYLVHFPTQLDSPSNSSGAWRYHPNSPTLLQNPSQTTSQKVLRHLHLSPWALYDLGLRLGCLGTSFHPLGRHPLVLYK